MHTPDEIQDPNLPEDDQPYAGTLYVDSMRYARRERWAHAWELKLGVVGPASQAEDVQKEFHDFIGADEPGWDTQLPNEPVINVSLTTAHLLAKGRRVNRPSGESCLSAAWGSAPTFETARKNSEFGVLLTDRPVREVRVLLRDAKQLEDLRAGSEACAISRCGAEAWRHA